ncbi:hypothetical protein Tco_0678442 [Tanacetum coccineum]|uniref:Uncharacterized protein n=1 Tax=Tanacetum coccineum TaxID=301880 RepID=A0ABQ4XG12_9ASTR
MALTAYADADHAGCQDTRRSTYGSAQFLGDKLSYKDGKVRYQFPRSHQSRRDLPRDNPLVSVEVLRTDKQGDSDVYTLEDPTLMLEIVSRIFFLRLNLPDHSVYKWALKKNQAECPPFTDHMMAICKEKEIVPLKAPKTSSKAEKKDQQATGGPISLGVTGEGAHSQLNSGMSASIHFKPIYVASTFIHIESASGHDASTDFTTEVDLGKSTPNDSISKQQGMDKGTQNYSLDHISIGTNPSGFVDKTKSARDGLKSAHTKTDLDSPKDDEPIIIQDGSDEEDHAEKVQPEEPKETKDASATHPPSPKSIQIQELTNQVLLLHSQKSKLKEEKTKVEDEAKIKTFDALLSLLNKVTEALNKYAQAIEFVSKKTGDTSVPSAGQAGSYPAEGEKNTKQDVEEKKTKSDSDDDTINLTGLIGKSSKKKKLKKFDFVTKQGDHVHFTEEQIKEQKRIEESIKADIAKQEVEIRKEEWIDLLGVDVVYREDGTNKVIPNFKDSDLHLSEWREVMKACQNIVGAGEQDPLDRLDDLARKNKKHANDIHDLFRSTKKFKSSVQCGEHPAGTVLNEPILGMILFFR